MSLPQKLSTARISCEKCGGDRNHRVVKQHEEKFEDPEAAYWEVDRYQVCKCRGCDSVRFCHENYVIGGYGPDGEYAPTTKVYPVPSTQRRPVRTPLRKIPVVGEIYRETVGAINAGLFVLAAAGIRAIVEGVCKDRRIRGKNLKEKIDGLAAKGFLAERQASFLHEARYLGNTALHKIKRPSESSVMLGLDIVEGLLNAIYLLADKARHLRRERYRTNKQPMRAGV